MSGCIQFRKYYTKVLNLKSTEHISVKDEALTV